jgi:hypothetical protein
MYMSITAVKPLADYQLELTFENSEQRIFDLKPYLSTGIFSELKDAAVFNSVHISFDTVEWNNEADIDPEVLYEESVPIPAKSSV